MTDRPRGALARTIRAALAEGERDRFGCKEESCTCERHLIIDGLGPPDPALLPRVRHLVRLEAMVGVGCKFGPNDLTPDQWDGLIVLAHERQWMSERSRMFRESLREEQTKIDKGLKEARELGGVPPPGVSLFPPSRKR